jgi:DNA repair protein RadC
MFGCSGAAFDFKQYHPIHEAAHVARSLPSFLRVSASVLLLVREVAGEYRSAGADEMLLAAQRLPVRQLRCSGALSSLALVRDLLRLRHGTLEWEAFAVAHLDLQRRVLGCVEMIRGTVPQSSAYPRGGG